MGLCQTAFSQATPSYPVLPRRRQDLRDKAEGILREVAFVLHLTRKVNQAIRQERPQA